MTPLTVVERLALLGTLVALFEGLHPSLDQWAQSSKDSSCKGLYGDHPVYRDGTPVGQETDDRTGMPTLTASQLGRRSVARHVASYSAGQLAGTVAATRVLGYRIPGRALLAGAAINAVTHAVIDRRKPLLWLAGKAGKRGYVDHCTAVRMDTEGALTAELSGPGSALMELDQSLHRSIGVLAAVVTTYLATRTSGSGTAN
ncbi:hypothetical protein [Streptomyces sp. NBC_01237]|uniref:hypothetical protein n=1 Tax=Streptomyces sp. NBC_01237 TaxID=2903790 RepID=UPI002DDB08ED|nr:hypothetical protein [Streptomyces sp. NBC_01237]WRZ76600.1 hypothetical protein OG251_36050 [Streptomyces sp. NBC_01237]